MEFYGQFPHVLDWVTSNFHSLPETLQRRLPVTVILSG